MSTDKKTIGAVQSPAQFQTLYSDIRQLIAKARSTAVKQVNQILTVTYWQIGRRIQTQVLSNNRTEYGK